MREHEKPEGPVNFPHHLPTRPIPADYNDKSSPAHVPSREDWRKPEGPINRHVSRARDVAERQGIPRGQLSVLTGTEPRTEAAKSTAGLLDSMKKARDAFVTDAMGCLENRNEVKPTQADLGRVHDEFRTLVETPTLPHTMTIPAGVTHGDILATVARLAPYGDGKLTWDRLLQALLTDATAGMTHVRRVLTARLGVLFDAPLRLCDLAGAHRITRMDAR